MIGQRSDIVPWMGFITTKAGEKYLCEGDNYAAFYGTVGTLAGECQFSYLLNRPSGEPDSNNSESVMQLNSPAPILFSEFTNKKEGGTYFFTGYKIYV